MEGVENERFRVKLRTDGALAITNIEENKIKVYKGIDKQIVALLLKYSKSSHVEKLILEKMGENAENVLGKLEHIIDELKDMNIINEEKNNTSYKINKQNLDIYSENLTKSLDEIYIEITKRCNLRCYHCYIDNDILKREMSIEKIQDIIDQAAEMGVLMIKVTGGEPLIHKDFFKIAKYIRDKNMLLRVYTNGTSLNEDVINNMYNCGVKEIQISVDGFYDETHDSIRRKKGNLNNIKQALPILEKNNIKTILSFTATDFNVSEIKYFSEYLKEFKHIKLNASLFMNYHNKQECNHDMLNVSNDTINELKRCAYTMQDVWSKKMDYGFTYSNDNIGYCGAGNFSMYISSIGEVYMCPVLQENSFRLGNVNGERLKDIWENSEALNEFRKYKLRDIDKCNSCQKVNECRGGCRVRAYLSNDSIYSHDPISCSMFLED
ncbi:radical SAM protein [Tissierella sp. MB52-C2]|uniref:radical SAM/SPASM domain-containing protein n=1 Tax=Tissierella sp. MB52-C2 TaxID=3070999 RepID=UPI00280B3E4F|nr:radical SAM protein [Tissierella sp. MB52-C2]WMM25966.1 radical SAM protein [Tissierella sp. MB52-C2]